MTSRRVAVVGSGVAGTAVALRLAEAGHEVDVFEKGPDVPYPHTHHRFRMLLDHVDPAHEAPAGTKLVEQSGDYPTQVRHELVQVVGGQATRWRAISLRMRPTDLRLRSEHGFGADWPVDYDELEPWYVAAERHLAVAGTDEDNPWAPPRSAPFPLPPFRLTEDDRLLAERLAGDGIHVHTTPQAITSADHDGRPACTNIGPTCNTCPTGARYSPNHHLRRAIATGRVHLQPSTSVRRLLTDARGRVVGLLVQGAEDDEPREHPAEQVVLAAGAVETARLLLLSRDERHPDGVGNASGHVGRHLTFHHMWSGNLHFDERLMPGRAAPMSGQSHAFLDPEGRGRHGGVKVELTSHLPKPGRTWDWTSGADVLADLEQRVRSRTVGMHAETEPSDSKRLTLGDGMDRLGDPVAHVAYQLTDFDLGTHAFAARAFRRIAAATGSTGALFADPGDYHSVYHHMGTARSAARPADGVVDADGFLHGNPEVTVVGASTFPTPSAINPTLTLLALTLRTADRLATRLGPPG